jgi:hypothetical protein
MANLDAAYLRYSGVKGALAGAVLAVLLAGCGGGNLVNTGPFGNGGPPTGLCSPAENPDRVYTAGGIAAFTNAGPAAVIDKVSLGHPHRLRLLAAYAVLITGHEAYGNWNGFPSPRQVSAGVRWSQRQHADGARIPPTPRGHDVVDLVLVVKLVGKTGTADGVDVYYHTSGGHYHLHINNTLGLTTARTIRKCPL